MTYDEIVLREQLAGITSPGWVEAAVTINGAALSIGQSLTLRVALNSFLYRTAEPDSLGCDAVGQRLRINYLARGGELVNMMRLNEPKETPHD